MMFAPFYLDFLLMLYCCQQISSLYRGLHVLGRYYLFTADSAPRALEVIASRLSVALSYRMRCCVVKLFSKLHKIVVVAYGEEHPATAEALSLIGQTHLALGTVFSLY